MKKNKRVVIIISIVILTIINLFLVFKKDTSIVEKNKVSKIERKEFSIFKEQTLGGEDWKESNDTAFPTSGYLLNMTESKCYGYNKELITPIPVTQELTKGSIDGRVTIESSKTIYCELYFDLDNKVPEINTFSITGKTSSGTELNNGYTYGLDVTYKGNWLDEDVVQYCISDNNQSCSNWTEISSKDITVTSPSLTSGDGEKTMYIYLKDKANNVSVTTTKSTAKITVDQTKPSVTLTLTGAADEGQTLSDSSQYTHTNNITYNASITESNIDSYCVYEDSCSYQPTTSTSFNKVNYTLTNTEGSHSVKIRVKDKAGNESDIETQSIKLDKTNPVATISSSSKDTSSITVTVGYEGQDSIIARQCRESGGSWVTASNSNGSCTISDLKDGQTYTIEGRVRDVSGRWNTDYPSVNVVTDKKGTPASELYNNHPAGLSETEIGGMKRFVGRCSATNNGCDGKVDNFVCFGYSKESDCKIAISDNDYIYRIIGITSDGKMKLIKNKALNNKTYQWDSRWDQVIKWEASELFSKINSNEFLTSLNQDWQYKIFITTWLYGDVGYGKSKDIPNSTADELYAIETGKAESWSGSYPFGEKVTWTDSIAAKIGLMYLSDYYYSYSGSGATNCYDDSSGCIDSWIHILRSGSSVPSRDEWVMARMGWSSDRSTFRWLTSNGTLGYCLSSQYNSVRPVFYLSTDASISSGSGTSANPFIIAKS